MAKKTKKVKEEVTEQTQNIDPIIYDGCDWVVQFDNDPPLLLTSSDKGSEDQQVTFIIKNNSESHIVFHDSSSGKTFKIYARPRQ